MDDDNDPWEVPELESADVHPSELDLPELALPPLLPDDPETRLREFVDQRSAVLRRREPPAMDEPDGD